MVVNWKAPDANERLMGALLAAHTEFKPDYKQIASFFGRGATYNSVEGQFRKYREMAKRLANGDPDDETSTARAKSTTPRAPRTPKTAQSNGITKSGSGKRAPANKKDKTSVSPTKSGKSKAFLNAITLSETDSDGDPRSVKSETVGIEDKMDGVKVEDDKMGVMALGFGSAPPAVDSQRNGFVLAEDDDDVFGEDA